MVSGKYLELIDSLLAKTEAGKIEWKKTAKPNAFQISFPHYSIMLEHKERFQQQEIPIIKTNSSEYIIVILDSEGRGVDFFTDRDLNNEYQERLAEIHQQARRQALGADKALDEILNALKDVR